MTTTYGVTPTGFVKKPLTVIKSELEADFRGAYGSGWDVSTESPTGQIIGIIADRLAEVWDAAEASYAAQTVDGATDVSLDNVAALTGTRRLKPTFSKVTVTLTGTPGASISAATFSVAGSGARFTMDADAVIGGGGTVSAACTANETGPVIAVAGTLTVIDTPRVGLTSVTNAFDATLGTNREQDPGVRVRRESELRSSGKAALEAVREAVLAVTDDDGARMVSSCLVFENDTDATDTDGLPPHSINVLATCDAGTDVDAAVAAAIYDSKGAGIQTVGASSSVVTDSAGVTHTLRFDRPAELDVYVRLDLIVDSSTWPTDGVAQVQAALVAYGNAVLVSGRDVVPSAVAAQAFKVSGVLDTGLAKLSLSPGPTLTATIGVSLRQIAKLDTSRITVFPTPGTP